MPEKGKFLRRINRFVTFVEFKKKKVKAYLANSGRLKEVLTEGAECLLEKGKGKIPYKLIAVKKDDVWVSVDSHLPNKFFYELYKRKEIDFLRKARFLSREFKIDGERIDFLFIRGKKRIFLEIKSCTLVEQGIAIFPDAPTIRGKRHLDLLSKLKENGDDAYIVFIVQRKDAKSFAPNSFTHFDFSKSLYRAMEKGVKVYLIVANFNDKKMKLEKIFIRKLDIFEILVNEYHLWRYPEVFIDYKKLKKNSFYLDFKGETCFHCSFEENFFDFIYFAKERGINLDPIKIESNIGHLIAKVRKT
ncbi:MAG: DNA/RNA nuclease SfsA [candidate division WOR-3 bacterium]